MKTHRPTTYFSATLLAVPILLALTACDDAETPGAADTTATADVADTSDTATGATDIKGATFTKTDAACTAYVGSYEAAVKDLTTGAAFTATVTIAASGSSCTITSNSIPSHDFNDAGAFASAVVAVVETFNVPAAPTAAATTTGLTLQYDNAIFLNGVKLDLLAAACYGVGTEPLGKEKIGCFETGKPWRYDPMHPGNSFGTDSHNAHTQPDGAYHYHGNPNAMFDATGAAVSGVIGFAADGFPIYGSWFDDAGTVRKAVSGFTLKSGARVSQTGEGAFPAGTYDGTYVDDYEWTGAGDLDECNGMTVGGSYGYYVTDAYPWVVGCFKGAPDASFKKQGP